MSMRYQASILTASYSPLKVPSAPTIGTTTIGSSQVTVTFTAPSDVGSSAITSYIVVVTNTATGISFTNTGTSSPIIVTGLTNDVAHTAKVAAINSYGAGEYSSNSTSFTPAIIGQVAYTTPGAYSWVAPAGVTSVSAVCVGATLSWANNQYFGRGGGGLGWKNNIAVVPGNSYTVIVSGSNDNRGSSFINTSTVLGGQGANQDGGTFVGDGGGNGGRGGDGTGATGSGGGGGGAGGYAGNGGNGGAQGANSGFAAAAGSGAGGGGAGGTAGSFGGGGGGVGILGKGADGVAGIYTASGEVETSGGGGGSGGARGSFSNTGGGYGPAQYGGGMAGTGAAVSGGNYGGAVRIIWGGGRAFPSTNTGDL